MILPKAPATEPRGGTLYVVATPIGNLEDVSLRALALLERVGTLLAEDTRHTRKLLTRFGIRRRVRSHHEHNEQRSIPQVLRALATGGSVALVSDAGTPAISDPGQRLVRAVIEAGHAVVPVPGPSAPLAALVASGLPTDRFCFVGYPPRTAAARLRFLRELRGAPGTLLLLESPRRLGATLASVCDAFGAATPVVVAREMTKTHEEFLRGPAGAILERLRGEPVRGEVTLCIGPRAAADAPPPGEPEIAAAYRRLIDEGWERPAAIRELRRRTGLRRKQIYDALIAADGDPR